MGFLDFLVNRDRNLAATRYAGRESATARAGRRRRARTVERQVRTRKSRNRNAFAAERKWLDGDGYRPRRRR